jgi:hypothetical protein
MKNLLRLRLLTAVAPHYARPDRAVDVKRQHVLTISAQTNGAQWLGQSIKQNSGDNVGDPCLSFQELFCVRCSVGSHYPANLRKTAWPEGQLVAGLFISSTGRE